MTLIAKPRILILVVAAAVAANLGAVHVTVCSAAGLVASANDVREDDPPTSTPTPTNTPTNTPTSTPTNTATNTPTNTPTSTPTNTATNTPTNTATNTPTNTATNTPTNTPTNAPTNTPTSTPTNTPTNAPTRTPTNTATTTPGVTEPLFLPLAARSARVPGTWQEVRDVRQPTYELAVCDHKIFATSGSGVFASNDGIKWDALQHSFGGAITGIDVTSDCTDLYVGVWRAGVWHSAGGGVGQWSLRYPDPSNRSILPVVVHESVHGHKVYVGTAAAVGGVYVSSDSGLSWQGIGLGSKSMRSLLVDGRGRLFAGTTDGIWSYKEQQWDSYHDFADRARSGDEPVKTAPPTVWAMLANSEDAGVGLAGTEGLGLFSLELVSDELWMLPVLSVPEAVVPGLWRSDDQVLAAVKGEGIYRSSLSDDGSWSRWSGSPRDPNDVCDFRGLTIVASGDGLWYNQSASNTRAPERFGVGSPGGSTGSGGGGAGESAAKLWRVRPGR